MFNESILFIASSGLSGVTSTLLQSWVQPVFLLAIAAMAIIFIKDRAWMKLLGFLGIAAVVAIPVFFGDSIFGQGGQLSGVGKNLAEQVNTVDAVSPVFENNAKVLE